MGREDWPCGETLLAETFVAGRELTCAVIGDKALPRTEVTKKVWEYIKKHKLQDATNKRMINADDKLKVIFKKAQVSMFEMTKLINGHLK